MLLSTLLFGLAALTPQATGDSVAIMKVVNAVFDGMRARDTALMRAQFTPDARMVRVSEKDGKRVAEIESPDGWIASIGRAKTKALLDERIFEPQLQVDGSIAHVWTYYEFWLGDKLSHCGYDSFFLVQLETGWSIVQVADTQRSSCNPRRG